MTLLAALSMVTHHVGLGATVSTSFSEPFHVARSFASLDHLSGGRAAWNVVTSTHNASALNFGRERLHEHDLRYEIATEFVDVVRGLWDTLGGRCDRRRQGDRHVPRSSPRCARSITKGASSRSRGRSTSSASPQGHPMIIQAGGSPPGQELSARSADLVFSVVNGDPASAKAAYDGLKQRVVKHGRSPEHVPILPGVMPIIGETERAGEGAARAPAELADTYQRAHAGVAAIGARHLGLSARRPGSRFSADRPRPGLFQDAAGYGAPRENDVARSLQRDRRSARPLGGLRHAETDRRHIRGMVHGRNGGRIRHHAGVFPRRIRRFRRPRGARAAAARLVPDASIRARPCATTSDCNGPPTSARSCRRPDRYRIGDGCGA